MPSPCGRRITSRSDIASPAMQNSRKAIRLPHRSRECIRHTLLWECVARRDQRIDPSVSDQAESRSSRAGWRRRASPCARASRAAMRERSAASFGCRAIHGGARAFRCAPSGAERAPPAWAPSCARLPSRRNHALEGRDWQAGCDQLGVVRRARGHTPRRGTPRPTQRGCESHTPDRRTPSVRRVGTRESSGQAGWRVL